MLEKLRRRTSLVWLKGKVTPPFQVLMRQSAHITRWSRWAVFNRRCQMLVCMSMVAHGVIGLLWPKSVFLCALLALLLLRRYVKSYFPYLCCVLAALSWANLYAWHGLEKRLDSAHQRADMHVIGRIITIPKSDAHIQLFDVEVLQAQIAQQKIHNIQRIRLSDYQNRHAYAYGQHFEFVVRLKRPQGLANPGQQYDAEKMAIVQGVHAKGYIRQATLLRKADNNILTLINALREQVRQMIAAGERDSDVDALLTALLVGMRHDMQTLHWQVLQRTGTSHLFAISGLHVGFVALLTSAMLSFCCRRFTFRAKTRPLQDGVIIVSLLVAFFYSALAGFSLPTQRALIALSVFALYQLMRRLYSPWDVWLMSMTIIVIWQPKSALSASFWLSFFAVAAIIAIYQLASNQLKAVASVTHKIRLWLYIQILLFVLLQPVTYAIFSQFSLVSPVANILAIPVIAFCIVPIGLIAVVFYGLYVLMPFSALLMVSQKLIHIAALVLGLLWEFLSYLASFDFASLSVPTLPWPLSVFWAMALLMLLLPMRSLRVMAIVCGCLLFLWRPNALPESAFKVTLFDVGQGLSVLVETRKHRLLYDTGASYVSGYSMAQSVIIPYFQHQGIAQLDMMVLSHRHNDHAGGWPYLQNKIKIKQKITGAPTQFESFNPCLRGQSWQWDGVRFEVLWPTYAYLAEHQDGGNNASCVIKISNGYKSIVLTGDIEASAEIAMIALNKQQLKTDIVQIPHHGSATSSSWSFLSALSAQYALISSGYLNRFSHPHQQVMARINQHGMSIKNTAQHGALTVTITPNHMTIKAQRDNARYWRY